MVTSITIEDAQRALARRDFGMYCSYVHGRPLYRHQQEWAKELTKERARTLIVAPPESFKSSTMRMYLEWCIGNNPDETCLLLMNTASQAQKQVAAISETLENNPKYRSVFPWIQPNPKRGWSHEVLFVRRKNESLPDPTLYGTGIDGPYQGAHVGIISVDDPTDQQDVRSEATMGSQRDRLHGVLMDRLNEGGSIYAILTRWGEADLVRDFQDMGFHTIINPIEGNYPWGRLLCPEEFGDDRLRDIRQAKGGQMYQLTYMCDPSASEGAVLKREWWRMYNVAPELTQVIHSWDLSTGKSELSDYSAYLSVGVAQDGYYILDAGRWRLGADSLMTKMKLLFEQSAPRARYLIVEDAGTSIPIVQLLQSRTTLPLVLVKPGTRDTVARVQGRVQALIEAGRVWLPAAAPWLNDFLDETASLPGGAHDDWVDALSQALEWLDKRSGDSQFFPMRRYTGGRYSRAGKQREYVK